ncbi:potassium voltage-gated channel subfamily C member 1 [Hydra vulgaris]|uniref:Potassium voltage-gated channel subfamily C member 1 n=1 Tax=Hydra vulgaris TaxID=6087 RepID=A0ABM4C6Y6_HYDVU
MHKQEEVYDCNKQNVDRVFINVGGTRHECFIKTLQNFPDTRLFWIAEMAIKMANFGEDVDEFFFDRHPGCFQNILNYCRTGKLHCPKDVCGPIFAEELAFWGVDELMMQPCCWPSYSEFNDASKNLKAFHDFPMNHYRKKKKQVHKFGSEQTKKCSKKTQFYKLKKALWNLTEIPQKNWLTKIVASIQVFTTLLSILTFCLATEPKLKTKYDFVFNYFEKSYCLIFTVDLLLKVLCCPSFFKLLKDFLIWVDVVSLLPFYFEFLLNANNEFLQSLRLLRIFRILRFFRNLRGMMMITVFGETLKASFEPLMLLGLVLFIPMVLFAAMVYYAEKNFSTNSQFKSIPKSCWWAIITLTTVGYGDIIPSSVVGKIVGVFCATFGVLVVALPISVIGNNFTFYYSYAKASMKLPKNRSKLLIDQDILNFNEKCDNERNSKSRRYGLPSLYFDSPKINTKVKLQDELSKSIFLPKILLSPHSDSTNELEAALFQTKDSNLKSFAESNSGINKIYKKTSLNKITNSPIYITNNFDNSLINNENKGNLKRSYSNVNEPIPFMLPFNISNDSCSSSQISLKSTSEERKKVIHADITQYVPRKLSARVRAEICRKLNVEYNNNY